MGIRVRVRISVRVRIKVSYTSKKWIFNSNLLFFEKFQAKRRFQWIIPIYNIYFRCKLFYYFYFLKSFLQQMSVDCHCHYGDSNSRRSHFLEILYKIENHTFILFICSFFLTLLLYFLISRFLFIHTNYMIKNKLNFLVVDLVFFIALDLI